MSNLDKSTIKSFSDQWVRYDQTGMTHKEALRIFKNYFSIFPWKKLSKSAEGFDMGCGTGRWAKFVAPKVRKLHCIDPSNAIKVAKKKLKNFKNINYHRRSLDKSGIKKNSQDFGYLLGVLHYVPDARAAIKSCVELLKPGAPILLYIYYSLENRPFWFKCLWNLSNLFRLIISRLPKFLNFLVCDLIAIFIYFPLAKISLISENIGFNLMNFPLYFYRNTSFYVMRTDSRDRFGSPLEKRYSKNQIYQMMKEAGLEKIKFKNSVPFWTVIGYKKH
ncbi:class I SAM-dependent methyltransferase [Candidatus Pelagibacter sp.]|nr:class I SAM-dependent methyltransferase [Candidatus Pelagibacter sp.]